MQGVKNAGSFCCLAFGPRTDTIETDNFGEKCFLEFQPFCYFHLLQKTYTLLKRLLQGNWKEKLW